MESEDGAAIQETREARRGELSAVERRLAEILKALGDGYRSEAWKAELVALDGRKAALTAALAEPPLPALHPQMADVFRKKATTLAAGLEHDAAQAICSNSSMSGTHRAHGTGAVPTQDDRCYISSY